MFLKSLTIFLGLLFCFSASASTLYSNGLVDIPAENRPPTEVMEKFQATFKPMNLVDQTELCHGYQVKKGLFTDKRLDMYVIRTKTYEKARNGEFYLYDIYAQFNNDAVTATFMWNTETDDGMSNDDRTIKSMYQGICNQSATVIRTKEQQISISKANGNFTPVAAKPCQLEREAFKNIDNQIKLEDAKTDLDKLYKSTEAFYQNRFDRLNSTIESSSDQARNNVYLQALMTKKLDAEKALSSCTDNKKQLQSNDVDPLDQLRKLKSLLDDKIISQKEFDAKKTHLLSK